LTLPYMLALVSVIFAALGQLSLKSASSLKIFSGSWMDRRPGIVRLGLGYGALFTAVSISAYNLRFIEANVLVSLSALSYPAVLALSRLVLDERLTKRQWIGLFIICGGVILYNLE
jgi:drug/metabolite transporter (DMT)-like permease